MASIAERIQENGDCCPVEGNQVLLLDDPDGMWSVCSGTVDVFAVPVDQAGNRHARLHLCRATRGQILCGCDFGSQDLPQLIAVGLPGSEVAHVQRSQLDELLRDAESSGDVSAAEAFAT
ncbi:MAG: hypothetical protein ACC645_28030, partial [Pirellulales bacterium]